MANAILPHSSEPVIDDKNHFTWAWNRFFEQLKIRIGAEKHYDLGGILHTTATTVGNVNGGEDDLITFTLEKNMMQNSGDTIEVIAFGTYGNNANNKTLNLYFDGTVVFTTGVKNPTNTSWQLVMRAVRVTATSQKVTVAFTGEALGGAVNSSYTLTTADLTTNNIIKCTGTGVATNDIVQEGMIIKFFPGHT